MQLPEACPTGGKIVVRHRDRIKKRFAAAGEAIEVWRPDALKCLLEEEVVVGSEDLDRV
jgi:hypothetical protein